MKLEIDTYNIEKKIISKIRDLIILKNLEPGDKLPSERVLSEKFSVSRRNVREAIERLEYYGLVKSIPQTGTFVANIGQIALNGVISDILRLKEQNFKSLVETRISLELKTVALAAERRTQENLEEIEGAFNAYKLKVLNRDDALQEDLIFHLAIARACGNSTINDLMLQITPKILSVFENNRVCDEEKFMYEINLHESIFLAIKEKNVAKAVEVMTLHFKMLTEYCNNFTEN